MEFWAGREELDPVNRLRWELWREFASADPEGSSSVPPLYHRTSENNDLDQSGPGLNIKKRRIDTVEEQRHSIEILYCFLWKI